MPKGNGSGPRGEGPKTGRGAGYCAGNDAPGYVGGGSGTGGRGWYGTPGRGHRNRYSRVDLYGFRDFGRTPDPEIEKAALEHRAVILRNELNEVDARLKDIAKKDLGPES